MAKDKSAEMNGSQAEQDPEIGSDSKSRFTEIRTESYMFNAEKTYASLPKADQLPLVGYLVGMQEMPPIKGRAWKAAIILTTEPVHALDREKKVLKLPPGSRVLIPATFAIDQNFARAASNSNFVFEVSISPSKKVEIGGGQTMWTYKLGANSKPVARAAFGIAALLDNPNTSPQLGMGSHAEDVEAPF